MEDEQVVENPELLQVVMGVMAEIVIVFDSNGQAVRSNPAAVQHLGIDPVSMSAAELKELLSIRHPNGAAMTVAELPFIKALRGEVISNEQVLITDKEEKEQAFLISASLLSAENGTSGVVSVWYNVTSREHLLEQLEVERSRLATIIENAPEAILVVNKEGSLVLGNPAAERIFNRILPFGQAYDSLESLRFCHPDGTPYPPRQFPLIRSALDGTRHLNIDILFTQEDAQKRSILASTAPIFDRKGNLNGAVGIFQDITLRRRVEDELRVQAARSQMLASLSQAFAEAGLDHRELLDTIVTQIGNLSGDMCIIQLVTDDAQWSTMAAFHNPDPVMQRKVQENIQDVHFPVTETNRNAGQVIRLVNASLEEMAAKLPPPYSLLLDYFPVHNGLIVPLRAHGRWIGTLGLLRTQRDRRYNMEDQFFYQDLADRAALAIEDSMLYEHEARRVRELHALHKATTALLSTIDLETLLVQILDAAQQAIPAAEQGVLYLIASETGSLEVRATIGFHDPRIQQVSSNQLKRHISKVVSDRIPLLDNNIPGRVYDNEAPEDGNTRRIRSAPIRSAISAPLILSGKLLGALSLTGTKPRLFQKSDLDLLDSFAATATAALHNATLHAEVRRLATTDPLTGQYNRHRFFELGEREIHRFRRYRNPLSAIMLDLDNFKDINDTFGHAAGDIVLTTAARRVKMNIRVVDILGRYGGDEFAILLPDADIEEAFDIAERIRQAILDEDILTDQGPVPISISLGVTQADASTENLSVLLGQADAALYIAKQNGRNQVASV